MMLKETETHRFDLAIIGTGLAGVAASIFALDRGLSVVQIGNTGALSYTTGYFDLLGLFDGALLDDPWRGLEALRTAEPGHPLARISPQDIRTAFERFVGAVSEMGVRYTAPGDANRFALLPTGTVKPTFSMPETMRTGGLAFAAKTNTLIVDFHGLQGFSGKEFVANFGAKWRSLSTARLAFPGMESNGELFAEVMARALEVPANRMALAERIKEVLSNAETVGLPAILGVHAPDSVHADMEELIGVPVFEIPTMPPSVPGLRLREMFERTAPARGLVLVSQHKVERLDTGANGFGLNFTDNFGDVRIDADAAILASGRFLSGGLAADRDGIRETLLTLPIDQPDNRADWYGAQYLDPKGHAINRCGVAVDDAFRPVNTVGELINNGLFAAGAVLAGQDWVRQRCGAGVAIATAYKAVEAAAAHIPMAVGLNDTGRFSHSN